MNRILVTPGEPAGIGPDITVKIAQQPWATELIVVGDPDLLLARAKQLDLPLKLIPFHQTDPIVSHIPGTLKIIPVLLKTHSIPGQLNPENAHYVIQCLELATHYCLQQLCDALVTGPVHKGILNNAGITFTGHTEFLAKCCHVKQPIMLFVTPETKVALATTHLALSEGPAALTQEKLKNLLRILHSELKKKFNLTEPRILVCGLNPHAGEQGHLGREEIDIISPALEELRLQGMKLVGPLPADTLFQPKYLDHADAVLAMYHDQALPVLKHKGFGRSVNISLGLPLIRTSVDHGTALDLAGTGKADPGSLFHALEQAIYLAQRAKL